jgi:hypothetical protein
MTAPATQRVGPVVESRVRPGGYRMVVDDARRFPGRREGDTLEVSPMTARPGLRYDSLDVR